MEVVLHRHVVVQRNALRQVTYLPPVAQRTQECVLPVYHNSPGIWHGKRRKNAQKRRLAGSVCADNAHRLAGRDDERHVAQNRLAPVRERKVPHLDHGSLRARPREAQATHVESTLSQIMKSLLYHISASRAAIRESYITYHSTQKKWHIVPARTKRCHTMCAYGSDFHR